MLVYREGTLWLYFVYEEINTAALFSSGSKAADKGPEASIGSG